MKETESSSETGNSATSPAVQTAIVETPAVQPAVTPTADRNPERTTTATVNGKPVQWIDTTLDR